MKLESMCSALMDIFKRIRSFVSTARQDSSMLRKLEGEAFMVFKGSVVDVRYLPDQKHTKTESQALAQVARSGAFIMDSIFSRREGIDEVNVWVQAWILLEDGPKEQVWTSMRVVLDRKSWQGVAAGSLSNLAAQDTGRYLKLCSLQYVDESELPEWPEPEAPYYPV